MEISQIVHDNTSLKDDGVVDSLGDVVGGLGLGRAGSRLRIPSLHEQHTNSYGSQGLISLSPLKRDTFLIKINSIYRVLSNKFYNLEEEGKDSDWRRAVLYVRS